MEKQRLEECPNCGNLFFSEILEGDPKPLPQQKCMGCLTDFKSKPRIWEVITGDIYWMVVEPHTCGTDYAWLHGFYLGKHTVSVTKKGITMSAKIQIWPEREPYRYKIQFSAEAHCIYRRKKKKEK